MKLIKTKTIKDGKKYYNFYIVVEVNGKSQWICIKNAFKNDWNTLNLIADYYDITKDE